MLASVLLACLPDLAAYTPTPTITWDRVPYCDREASDPLWTVDCSIGSYRVYERAWPDPAWTLVDERPCWWYVDDLSEGPTRICEIQVAPQRWTDAQLAERDYCVTAVSLLGEESVACSNVVTVCLPDLWDGPPQPYE